MSEHPDLTPVTYLNRGRTRGALRRWVVATVVCAITAAAPIAILSTQGSDSQAAQAEERFAQAQARITQSDTAAKQAAAALIKSERELHAAEHLTKRPDWGGVIRLVTRQFGDRVMMQSLRLAGSDDSAVRGALKTLGPEAPEGSVWLIVSGVAGENSDVHALVLRLEQLGLFDRVLMTGTQREVFSGQQRTGFMLACRVE